ncbi:MAG: Uma2 family endonuclease [Dehalococcoidia bacterium]
MAVSPATYERLALEDPDSKWELVCGRVRRKPPMTTEHNEVETELAYILRSQLNPAEYRVRSDSGRVRKHATYYIPDVFVAPTAAVQSFLGTGSLEVFETALPLVVEVWSKSTGEYDVDEKLAEYQRRGDLEIWRIHPYEKTLTSWVRTPNGTYTETLHRAGTVTCAALPGVIVDLATLFALV